MWCQNEHGRYLNLNNELERQKLEQIDARNIGTSLRQTYSFFEVKLQQSDEAGQR